MTPPILRQTTTVHPSVESRLTAPLAISTIRAKQLCGEFVADWTLKDAKNPFGAVVDLWGRVSRLLTTMAPTC